MKPESMYLYYTAYVLHGEHEVHVSQIRRNKKDREGMKDFVKYWGPLKKSLDIERIETFAIKERR